MRNTFMDKRIIDDARIMDQVGGDLAFLILFLMQGESLCPDESSSHRRRTADGTPDQLVEYIALLSEHGFDVSASVEGESV